MSDPPSNRCGYTWSPNYETLDRPKHQSCCWRPTLDDTDRCAWHADPEDTNKKTITALKKVRPDPMVREQNKPYAELLDGAILSGCEIDSQISLTRVRLRGADLTDTDLSNTNLAHANLYNADLTDANLSNADLTNVNLYNADLINANLYCADLTDNYLFNANLTEAYLSNANLANADLYKADFTDADLWEANFTDADLSDTDVNGNLERANLTRASLFGTDLRGAEFYAAVTTDTQIDEDTQFGDHYVSDQGIVSHEDSQKARWCERTIEQVAEDNALPGTAQDAFLTRQRLRRRESWREHDWQIWIPLTVSGLLMGYGESFKRVLTSAAVVIGTATMLYPWLGVRPSETGSKLAYPSPISNTPMQFLTELVDTLLTSGYFSVLTFTTLGFGDLRPVGLGRVIATVEAGFGVTLFALFVFVLGRRATR